MEPLKRLVTDGGRNSALLEEQTREPQRKRPGSYGFDSYSTGWLGTVGHCSLLWEEWRNSPNSRWPRFRLEGQAGVILINHTHWPLQQPVRISHYLWGRVCWHTINHTWYSRNLCHVCSVLIRLMVYLGLGITKLTNARTLVFSGFTTWHVTGEFHVNWISSGDCFSYRLSFPTVTVD